MIEFLGLLQASSSVEANLLQFMAGLITTSALIRAFYSNRALSIRFPGKKLAINTLPTLFIRQSVYHLYQNKSFGLWYSTKNPTGSTETQLYAEFHISNPSDLPLRINAAQLLTPRIQRQNVLHAKLDIRSTPPGTGTSIIAPHASERVSVHLIASEWLRTPGKTLTAEFMFISDPPSTWPLRAKLHWALARHSLGMFPRRTEVGTGRF